MRKPYYPESQTIWAEIKKAKRILTNCHQSPDWDSVGSALALKHVLENLGHRVTIICAESIPEPEIYLDGAAGIKRTNFRDFGTRDYDLFVCLDTSDAYRITASKDAPQPAVRTVVIDHHPNTLKAEVRMVYPQESSTSIILYKLFSDVGVTVDAVAATHLYTGIVGDTLFFKTPNVSPKTFTIAAEMLKRGADTNKVIRLMFNSHSLDIVNLLGLVFEKTIIDKTGNFAWAAIDYATFEKFNKPSELKSIALDSFVNSIIGISFSLVILEHEPGKIGVSFRSSDSFNVGKLAGLMGGGGHEKSAAARLDGKYEEIVEKILQTARDFAISSQGL